MQKSAQKNFTLFLGDKDWASQIVKAQIQTKKGEASPLHFRLEETDYRWPLEKEVQAIFAEIEAELDSGGGLFAQSWFLEFQDVESLPVKTEKSSALKKDAQAAKDFFSTFLTKLVKKKPSHFHLFFFSSQTLMQKLPVFWSHLVENFDGKVQGVELNFENLRAHLTKKAKVWNLEISPFFIEQMILLKGNHLRGLEQDLEKMRYAAFLGQKITEKDLQNLVSKNHFETIFQFTELILSRKFLFALPLFQHFVEQNPQELILIFGLLSSRLRKMLKLHYRKQAGEKNSEIANQTKQPLWLVEKDWELAKRVRLETLEHFLILLSDEDLKIKFLNKDGVKAFTRILFEYFSPPSHLPIKNNWIPA